MYSETFLKNIESPIILACTGQRNSVHEQEIEKRWPIDREEVFEAAVSTAAIVLARADEFVAGFEYASTTFGVAGE